MAESAALLVDEVLPRQPMRQWVLSFPYQLRFLFASRPEIMGRVLGIVYRVIAAHLVKKAGYTHATTRTGAVTLIQRFGGALNLNIHFHMLFLDGVYTDVPNGSARFRWVKAPTSAELTQLARTIAHRVSRFLERRGLLELEKALPTGLVLLVPLGNAQHLAMAVLAHTNGHQHRDITDLAGPTALEHDAVEVDVRIPAFDRPVPPGLDVLVDLLVELADRRGADLGAPQRFGDVLHPAYRHTGQVHLDQCLFHRGLPSPVALDDRRLKGLLAQLRHVQRHLPRLRLQLALVIWEDRFEHDRLELLDKVCEQTGDRKQLKEIRSRLFQSEQSYASFTRYLEALDEDEKEKACGSAIKQAEQGGNILRSADLLLNLGQTERARTLVLARHQELAECFYDSLLKLAKAFDKADCSLAATACYRALLLDILAQARSKAYGHGARYYKNLEALAKRIKEFTPLPTHHAFVQQLHSAHGRKKSFWARLES